MRATLEFLLLINLALAVLFVSPQRSCAHFERIHSSSRVIALGGAFAGIADDPSALVSNPAGIAGIPGYSFLSTLIHPYGLESLEETFFAAVVPVGIGNAGLSWHRLSLRGVISEDLITIGFGRDYIRTSQDASLSFGGTVDIARVSYGQPYESSKTMVTGSLGVLLRPFPIIGIGYAVRNVVPGSLEFIPGNGETRLERTHVWSIAYHWNEMVSVVFDRARSQEGQWGNRVGVEVLIHRNLRFRSGVHGDDISGGVGIMISEIKVDIGVASHDVMGMSYVLSLGYSFSPKAKENHETR